MMLSINFGGSYVDFRNAEYWSPEREINMAFVEALSYRAQYELDEEDTATAIAFVKAYMQSHPFAEERELNGSWYLPSDYCAEMAEAYQQSEEYYHYPIVEFLRKLAD